MRLVKLNDIFINKKNMNIKFMNLEYLNSIQIIF